MVSSPSSAKLLRQTEYSRGVRTNVPADLRLGMSPKPVDSAECVAPARRVPVASVLRQLRSVASPLVASASPRAVLTHGLQSARRAAALKVQLRIIERLAGSSAVRFRKLRQMASR